MKKITHIKSFALLITFLSVISFGYGQEIASYSSVANAGCSGIVSTVANINLASTTGICRGTGINANAGGTYNSRDWTTAATLDIGDYLEWTLAPSTGYEIDLATMDITYDRSAQGPTMTDIQINTGSGFLSIFTDATVSASSENNNGIDLTAFSNITGIITFRLYAFNSTSAGGTFDIEENIVTNKGIVVNGIVTALPSCSSPAVTWVAGAWSPLSGPTINTPVVIADNYNTTSFGSFSACDLTVNTGFLLRVNDGTYLEIENDVTVDGQLFIETQGNFVQNNNNGFFTDNSTNDVQVTKTKSMYRKLAYTYWSSPVIGETIEQTFGNTPENRRYTFNATNFVDMLEEIANTNGFLNNPGVDDLDDDGNDWEITTTGTMQAGIGYTTTASEVVGPGGYPSLENFVFRGAFNNGIIQVPLINNSGGVYNDWNFIGNPYPGALSIDQFFTVNSGLVGVVYLWDQATPENGNAGGNQNNNFSVDDYAMVNGVMEVGARGGTGNTPNRFIASGQGFFVEALNAGNITFNNSMRSSGADNSQFFKNSNPKNKSTNIANKLWLNLISDNGASNQIGIGYVVGATKNDDGAFYDAVKNFSAGAFASLYSIIENSDKKFAIQGKNSNDLNENEIINLGFKTSIDVATLYTLSIAQLKGDYLNGNTIYLKDNLLNKLHNLSDSDYTFTSEVGEFKNRFQIAFSDKALSIDNVDLDKNNLSIIELNNDHVQFKISNGFNIKTVIIYDLLGRQLYNLKGQSNSETYLLSNLKNAIYIAKVELSNGTIVTKKAIKR